MANQRIIHMHLKCYQGKRFTLNVSNFNNNLKLKYDFSLANKEHVVYTGVCLKTPKQEVNFYESTKVKFGDISEEQIWTYIKSGEPLWVYFL